MSSFKIGLQTSNHSWGNDLIEIRSGYRIDCISVYHLNLMFKSDLIYRQPYKILGEFIVNIYIYIQINDYQWRSQYVNFGGQTKIRRAT